MLQRQMDLDAEDLRSRCDDDDCCSHENEDLPVIDEDLLGKTTPPTRHLLKAQFGWKFCTNWSLEQLFLKLL